MTKWEYKVDFIREPMCRDYGPLTERLNELGNQGWELVSFECTGGNMVTTNYRLVFKRPVNDGL